MPTRPPKKRRQKIASGLTGELVGALEPPGCDADEEMPAPLFGAGTDLVEPGDAKERQSSFLVPDIATIKLRPLPTNQTIFLTSK
jgi:hypothetical protein